MLNTMSMKFCNTENQDIGREFSPKSATKLHALGVAFDHYENQAIG